MRLGSHLAVGAEVTNLLQSGEGVAGGAAGPHPPGATSRAGNPGATAVPIRPLVWELPYTLKRKKKKKFKYEIKKGK